MGKLQEKSLRNSSSLIYISHKINVFKLSFGNNFMDYIITDEGLRVLKEQGLSEKVDQHFSELNSEVLSRGIWSSDEIREYLSEERIHPLYEKQTRDDEIWLSDNDEFKIFSFMAPNFLVRKKVIPKDLPDTIMSAIGAYLLTKWVMTPFPKRSFTLRNNRFQTQVQGDTHGDFYLSQYDHSIDDSQQVLFSGTEPLIKKLERDKTCNYMYGHYDYWTEFLQSLILFCCQTCMDVPFRHNFLDVFYEGKPIDERPGMVAEYKINHFKNVYKYAKTDISLQLCLPKYPGFEEQSEQGWGFAGHIEENQGFIMDGKLVFCRKQEDGPIDFSIWEKFSEPKIIFTPEDIKEALYGTVRVIRDGAGRNAPQDPGLYLKYFPYDLFE